MKAEPEKPDISKETVGRSPIEDFVGVLPALSGIEEIDAWIRELRDENNDAARGDER
jgi:hypothetical protein